MQTILQSANAEVLPFFLVSSVDGKSGVTGLGTAPVVTLSKNGGAFAAAAGTVSEIGSGWYALAGNTTDSNTLGPLLLHAVGTGADPADVKFHVTAIDPRTVPATALLDLAAGIETGLTLRQGLRLALATLAGKISGANSSTGVIRNAVADSKDRITATVDADGNRTAVTVDLT